MAGKCSTRGPNYSKKKNCAVPSKYVTVRHLGFYRRNYIFFFFPPKPNFFSDKNSSTITLGQTILNSKSFTRYERKCIEKKFTSFQNIVTKNVRVRRANNTPSKSISYTFKQNYRPSVEFNQ